MTEYRVFVTQEYEQQLSKINKSDRILIKKKMQQYVIPQLRSEPHFGSNIRKLKNYNPPTWRYRIGKYRVFYEIDNKTMEVNILTISQRKDAY